MNLSSYISSIKNSGRTVYMPYLTIGDPDFDATKDFALAMCDQGADIIELGIPFSDPTADGPVIQQAMARALSLKDYSFDKVFDTVDAIHQERPDIPLVFLSYLNPVLNGFLHRNENARSDYQVTENIKRFLERCEETGISGVVIPDLPHDSPESKIFRKMAKKLEIDQIFMIAPNTSASRFKEICHFASGFIYYVTSLGVTGERKELPADLPQKLDAIRKESGLPVLTGFGFSSPEQVQPLRGIADGIIVGSLNHRIIGKLGRDALSELATITGRFTAALGNSPDSASD